jgi:DNA (cytosine-5)-methyltransferase 1
VPKWRGIKDVTAESTGIFQPTLISGGFPCQPFSCAGKQKGKDDNRYLWPEMLRVIRELQPKWVVGENVPGIIKIALDDILDSIEAEGYSTQTYSYPVSLLGACHKRERIFIVAHNNKIGCDNEQSERKGVFWNQQTCNEDRERNCDDPNDNREHREEHITRNQLRQERTEMSLGRSIHEPFGNEHWIDAATRLCRMDDGISHRVDRLKCLGNSIVPQQVYPILKAIADIERGNLK